MESETDFYSLSNKPTVSKQSVDRKAAPVEPKRGKGISVNGVGQVVYPLHNKFYAKRDHAKLTDGKPIVGEVEQVPDVAL